MSMRLSAVVLIQRIARGIRARRQVKAQLCMIM